MIDLRSDTFTKPTDAMRQAMASAAVGDDVYREDPTINELERACAKTLGKEAALFVPSGTMGNLACVLAHCGRGDEAIVGDEAHIFYYETGGASALGGVAFHTVKNNGGLLDPGDIERAIRDPDVHNPRTALLCVENTHNRGGGRALTVDEMRAITAPARARGIAVHLDGARLFNAAIATGTRPADLAADADSVSVCFSKGLRAPVGSAIAGTSAFVERCRRYRKMLGGGMRQAGILAAAALIALDEGPKRLHIDHENAAEFHDSLEAGGRFDSHPPQTNIVHFSPRENPSRDADVLLAAWRNAGVLVNHVGEGRFRAMTYADVSREDVLDAARRLERAL